MTPMRKDSTIHDFLKRVLLNWEYIYIRVEREGKWQDLNLEDVSEAELKKWLLEKLAS